MKTVFITIFLWKQVVGIEKSNPRWSYERKSPFGLRASPSITSRDAVRGGSAVKVASNVKISELVLNESAAFMYIDPTKIVTADGGDTIEPSANRSSNSSDSMTNALDQNEYRKAMIRTGITVAAAG